MIKRLFGQPLFLIGASFIFLLLVASLILLIGFHGYVPQQVFHFNSKGVLMAKAPLAPWQDPPFGTNFIGYDLFLKIIKGAKYTLGVAFIVAALRLVISVLLGLFYGNYLMRFKKYFSGVVNAFYYMPMALVTYLVLANSHIFTVRGMQTFAVSDLTRYGFEMIVLTIVALPTTILLVGDETSLILKQEFITSARVMGANRLHIIRKHVMPQLGPRLWILFVEQVIQVLILLVHMGLFKLFFGGTVIQENPITHEKLFISPTGEWSGLIGANYQFLQYYPWMPLVTLFAFAFTILAMNFILEGLKTAIDKRDVPVLVTRPKKEKVKPEKTRLPAHPSFEYIRTGEQIKT